MKWRLIGPDGIPDRPEPYETPTEAAHALVEFIGRYQGQGYYSSAVNGRIELDMMHESCSNRAC